MITQKLKRAVVKEALALRKYATEEEKAFLSHSKINGGSDFSCLYGTMTGDCKNKRSTELLNKCAKPFSYSNQHLYKSTAKKFESRIRAEWPDRYSYSAIEFYICQPGAKISDLIGLIKS